MDELIDEELFDSNRTGFKSIKKIAQLTLLIVARFWKVCSIAILFLFLLYWLYGGIVTLFLLIGAFVGMFYHYQDSLLYFPDQPENSRIFVQSPRFLNISYENLHFKTKDGVCLNAVLLKQHGNRMHIAPTIVMFHGNAGNIGHRLTNAYLFYTYTGSNVLLLDYRGYGKSDGAPSEKGLEIDAMSCIEYLLARSDIDPYKLVIHGRSLGGAVAFKLAAHEKYKHLLFAVIVENTFTSIPDMAKHLFVWLHRLPHWCYKNKFCSIDLVKNISTPTLFLSGLADQLVPPKQMMKLYNLSGGCIKKIECFESGTHNETWTCNGYTDVINRFLNEVNEARRNGIIPKSFIHQSGDSCKKTESVIDI